MVNFPKSITETVEDELGKEQYRLDITQNLKTVIQKLKSCSTCSYYDSEADELYLDYWVNDETKKAFAYNFDSSIELFQAFQILLMAYDHYLPKRKYPFTSINFKNLAPICNKCNSGNKLSKDPLHDKTGNRRKTFYPYNVDPYDLEIGIELNLNNFENLTPQDITISFGPSSFKKELTTWNDLFGIEERYKAVCCSTDAKYWVAQIFEECGDSSPCEFLSIRLKCAQKFPYSDTNFLRIPFLKACEEQHIFSI